MGTLSTMIPSSPGYLGTFDFFKAQGLSAHDASPPLAVAFALTASGLAYLLWQGRRLLRGRRWRNAQRA
jgi:hypothetical protein